MSAMLLSRIVEVADSLFPFAEAESWDNCGIQIGIPERVVSGVAFALDATPTTVKFASDRSCQLLVTHHPVLLEPIRRILPDSLTGKTLLTAATMGVDILSLHTNLDAAPGGLNDELACRLGLTDVIRPLTAKCARVGWLPEPKRLTDLAEAIAREFGLSGTRVVAGNDHEVSRVFSVSGSGMGYLTQALQEKCDVIVTGDVRYHAAREAAAMDIAVIDAGHFGLEKIAVPLLERRFRAEFEKLGENLLCFCCDLEEEPFVDIYNPHGGP